MADRPTSPGAATTGRSPFPPDIADARAAVAHAYRDLGHAFSAHALEADLLDDLRSTLDEWTRRLDEAGIPRTRADERGPQEWVRPPQDGEAMSSFDDRPISGRAAPIGIDLDIVREGDEAVARFTLGRAHEGAPDRSHGGIVAAVLDDVYGFVLTIVEQPGFTGTLTVRYEAGTPIGEPLECRVRLDGRDGRKLFMSGEVSSADRSRRYASSTATFIGVDFESFRRTAKPT